MNLSDLPAAHLGPIELEGLNWMALHDGQTRHATTGVTTSLTTARAADSWLRDLGFVRAGSSSYGPLRRLFQFDYHWYERTGDMVEHVRTVEIVLTAVDIQDLPWYEIVDQGDQRQQPLFGHLEVEGKMREIYRTRFLYVRPTLDRKPR